MSGLRYTLIGFILLAVQILMGEFINIWPPLYLCVIPLFIIILPQRTGTVLLMLIAFTIGILTDVLSDGILGLNAAACTAVAYSKNFTVKALTKYGREDAANNISSFTMGWRNFLALLCICYLVYFFVYILLDGIGTSSISFMLLRLVANVGINVFITYILESLWIRRLFS